MKRLTMIVVFLVIGSIAGAAYWYWTQPSNSAATGETKAKKGKGKGKGTGGPLTVRATQAIVKPMPVLLPAKLEDL